MGHRDNGSERTGRDWIRSSAATLLSISGR
jgi:hypothetical protein